jgi:lipopolysaccharide transport system permease protein
MEYHLSGRNRLLHALELIYLLVLKDLKARYKSSVLGYLWAIANPFAFAFVYWLTFKYVMRVNIPNYSIYLIVGMFPWIWLSTGVTQATRSFQSNASLVKKVVLPRSALPFSNIAEEMVHFLFALPVILTFLWFAGDEPLRLAWLWQVPVMMLFQVAFAFPIAVIFALANVFVHDIEYLVGIGFSMLFFLTPIVYSSSMVPASFRAYFELNPVVGLIDGWRSVFFHGVMDWSALTYPFLVALTFGVIARIFYARFSPRIGELL